LNREEHLNKADLRKQREQGSNLVGLEEEDKREEHQEK